MHNVHYTIIYVHTFLHLYIYTYIHIYIYTYIHIYIYTYIQIHIYIYTYIHIYICTYIHIYIYTFIHIHIYINTYIHIFIYIYTYTHFKTHRCSNFRYIKAQRSCICARYPILTQWMIRIHTLKRGEDKIHEMCPTEAVTSVGSFCMRIQSVP